MSHHLQAPTHCSHVHYPATTFKLYAACWCSQVHASDLLMHEAQAAVVSHQPQAPTPLVAEDGRGLLECMDGDFRSRARFVVEMSQEPHMGSHLQAGTSRLA